MKYIVNVSGGLTSFEALRLTLERYGKENTRAIFADTTIEDEDLYRFLDDQERYFGITIERVKDGRTPWQAMKDEGYITLRSKSGVDIVPWRPPHESVYVCGQSKLAKGAFVRCKLLGD